MIFGSLLLDNLRGSELTDEIKRFEKFGGDGYDLMVQLATEDWDAVLRGDK
jgi:hypothetical protein